MLRLGLCCLFKREPIKFRNTTAKYVLTLEEKERLQVISKLLLDNLETLQSAFSYCVEHKIGSFRISSRLFPLYTHPKVGYQLRQLPNYAEIVLKLKACQKFALQNGLRLTFHPDQFVVLNSPKKEVLENSLRELRYQAFLAENLGADVITIHAGGTYGDKQGALERLVLNLKKLPKAILKRLALENDDKNYTPKDLFPVCQAVGLPLVYDVHHHRCHPDNLSEEEATLLVLQTWKREPLFHLSSARKNGPKQLHADFIHPHDLPHFWLALPKLVTVEIEAKAKELAVLKLMTDLKQRKFTKE